MNQPAAKPFNTLKGLLPFLKPHRRLVAFWLLALALFAVATRVGRYFGLIPIVSQLLLASFGLPLLMYFWIEPGWQLSGAELIAPEWLKNLYSLSFAFLLGHIRSVLIDLDL